MKIIHITDKSLGRNLGKHMALVEMTFLFSKTSLLLDFFLLGRTFEMWCVDDNIVLRRDKGQMSTDVEDLITIFIQLTRLCVPLNDLTRAYTHFTKILLIKPSFDYDEGFSRPVNSVISIKRVYQLLQQVHSTTQFFFVAFELCISLLKDGFVLQIGNHLLPELMMEPLNTNKVQKCDDKSIKMFRKKKIARENKLQFLVTNIASTASATKMVINNNFSSNFLDIILLFPT